MSARVALEKVQLTVCNGNLEWFDSSGGGVVGHFASLQFLYFTATADEMLIGIQGDILIIE